MVYILIHLHAAPGQIDNVLKHLSGLKGIRDYALTSGEQVGTLTYVITQGVEDKNSVYIWEEFESLDALQKLKDSEIFQTAHGESSTLLDRERTVTFLSGV
ncbi:hypothetical protein BCR39DRAFT_526868 [Naematelia encephala]|uniref:ABM domain-containing protein n=1 Tax=Naematelia encephala TaxID=71784 RepID=A0A1Y2B8N4_9TREE|nr:hypothetical protein BCR39DRAFT_526868 [Naematelia encephala]